MEPVVGGFRRWLAPAALSAGLCLYLFGLAKPPYASDATSWVFLVVGLLSAFVVMGTALIPSIKFGNRSSRWILSDLDIPDRRLVKARRQSLMVEDRLRVVRHRYAKTREEVDNRGALSIGALAMVNAGIPVQTTTDAVLHLIALAFFAAGGAWSVVSAERWRAVAQTMAARDKPGDHLVAEPGP